MGYDGIVPTIRLKALRDAIEDYEYLAILNRLGRGEEARKIVRRATQSFFQWGENPAAYEEARISRPTIVAAPKAVPEVDCHDIRPNRKDGTLSGILSITVAGVVVGTAWAEREADQSSSSAPVWQPAMGGSEEQAP